MSAWQPEFATRGRAWRALRGVPAAVCAAALLTAGAAPAAARPAISEFSAGIAKGRHLTNLVAGRDGNMWFVGSGCLTVECPRPPHDVIGRVTPAGKITEFKLPMAEITSLTAGPGRDLWFLGPRTASIGRITASGRVTIIRSGLPAGFEGTGDVLTGPDGLVYFPAKWRAAGRTVRGFVRIGESTAPQTVVTDTPFNVWLSLAGDGNFWNAGSSARNAGAGYYLQRVTPAGVVTRFTQGLEDLRYLCGANPQIATDGSIWCTAITSAEVRLLLRMDPHSGQIQRFATSAFPTFARPDGAWWLPIASPSAGDDRRRAARAAVARSFEVDQITAAGAITTVASSPLKSNEQILHTCLAADDSTFFIVEVTRPVRERRRLGRYRLELRRLAAGARSATVIGSVPGFFETSGDFPQECVAGPRGGLWYVTNGPPRAGARPWQYRHRVGRITTR